MKPQTVAHGILLFLILVLIIRIDYHVKPRRDLVISDTLELPVEDFLYTVKIDANKRTNQITVRILEAENISKSYIEYWEHIDNDPIVKQHIKSKKP